MTKKAFPILVLIAAAVLGFWQMSRVSRTHRQAAPLNTRVTFDYQGTVKGLFDTVREKTGVEYEVAPDVANLPFHGSFKDSSLVQVQDIVSGQAPVRYRPPLPGKTGIQVQLRRSR